MGSTSTTGRLLYRNMYTFDVETLRALAHMAGVTVKSIAPKGSVTPWTHTYLRYRNHGSGLSDDRDPFMWMSVLQYLARETSVMLPDYVTRFPMSALDAITDEAGLAAFCALAGFTLTSARYSNMQSRYEYRGMGQDFCFSDPLSHKKAIVAALVQRKLELGV